VGVLEVKEVEDVKDSDWEAAGFASESAEIVGEAVARGAVTAGGSGGSERSGRGRCHISAGGRLRCSRSDWSSRK
jgi:hypothetical protein